MAEQEGSVTPSQGERGGAASVGVVGVAAGAPAAAGVAAANAPAAASGPVAAAPAPKAGPYDPFIRAENEDDDGYDPYSDRPAPREPMFERDPWG